MNFLDYKGFLSESVKSDVMLEFPELRQVYNYDCGASAFQQVLVYYGIEKREDELIKQLQTTKTEYIEHGTKLYKMKSVAEYYGLETEVKNGVSIEEVVQMINKKIPVILLIQAWRDFSDDVDWKNDFNDGHYVVAIGYNDNCIIFEDPSSFTRTYLSKEELKERWHDLGDDEKTHVHHTAVIIYGTPKFKPNEIVHMD